MHSNPGFTTPIKSPHPPPPPCAAKMHCPNIFDFRARRRDSGKKKLCPPPPPPPTEMVPYAYDSWYCLILWNQVDSLPKHFKKDHVHMRLWTRLYGICVTNYKFHCTVEN